MSEPFKPIFEAAGRGGKDLVAFSVVVAGTMIALIAHADPVATISAATVLLIVWCGMRYALLKVQSAEQLHQQRQGATIQATALFEKHASANEKEIVKRIAKARPGKNNGTE